MTRRTGTALLWAPRILGLLVALFIGAFALDAVGDGAAAFLVHVAPALVLLAAVIVSWRAPWLGGIVFISCAALYAFYAWPRQDWLLAISGPLLAVGVLFVWSGRNWVH